MRLGRDARGARAVASLTASEVRWPECPAVDDRLRERHYGQPAVVVEDAARRLRRQDLDRRVGGAGGEDPVVHDAEASWRGIGVERDLDAVLEHDRLAGGGGHGNDATGSIDCRAALVPAAHARVSRGVEWVERAGG